MPHDRKIDGIVSAGVPCGRAEPGSEGKRRRKTFFAVAAIASISVASPASELGHYFPASASVREFVFPDEPGFYGLLYTTYYTSNRLNDRSGDKLRSFTVNPGPGPGVTLDLDTDLDLFALAPMLMWIPGGSFLV